MLARPHLHRSLLLLLLVLAGLLVASSTEAQLELYVTNQRGELDTTAADSVIVYELASTGDLTFKRILTGPSTQLNVPSGLAVTQDKVFVANQGSCEANELGNRVANPGDDGSITIYLRSVSGDAPPTWIIRGPTTGLNCPFGLVVKDDELFVANQSAAVGQGSITVYKLKDALGHPVLSSPGGVLPLEPDRTIEGPLSGPSFIVVTNNELFVANTFSGIVTVHDRNATGDQVLRSFRNVGFEPFVFPLGLAINDTQTELFLAHGFFLSSTIAVFRPDAEGAAPPLRTLNGAETKLDRPSGLALSGDHLVVANQSTANTRGSIAVFDRTFGQREPVVRPPYTDDRLFSPVSLVVTPGLSFDYILKVGSVPPAAPGSVVDIKITAELLAGSGTVTFLSVEGLPGGGLFSPTTCPLSCETTLTINPPASTPAGTYTITARAVGTPTGCNAAECAVERFVSFPLVIREGVVLTVVKDGSGSGTVGSAPAGIACGLVCAAPFALGTTVTLTASPASDSIFAGWSGGGCTGTGTCTVTLTGPTTVTATFTRVVVLTVVKDGSGSGTVASAPAGIACGLVCAAPFALGTTVTLTASPDFGSRFVGWNGGGCTGTGACTVTLTGPTTVTATFNRIVSLTVVKKTVVENGTGGGTVTSAPAGISCSPNCSATFDLGTRVTLTARADSGSEFAGWRLPARGLDLALLISCGGVAPCTITVTGDATVEAYFGTPQEAFIARLDLNLLDFPPQNVQALIDSLTPLPTLTIRALLDAFLDGPRFTQRLLTELTPSSYVTVLFRAILGREPTPEERASAIRTFFSPVVKDLIGSSEFQGRIGSTQEIVRSFFLGFLGREPTGDELRAGVDSVNQSPNQSEGFLRVALDLLSSDEYQLRRTVPGIREDVRIIFRGLLAREPNETTEVNPRTTQLLEERKAIEVDLINGAEFQALFSLLFPSPLDLP